MKFIFTEVDQNIIRNIIILFIFLTRKILIKIKKNKNFILKKK